MAWGREAPAGDRPVLRMGKGGSRELSPLPLAGLSEPSGSRRPGC